MPRIEETRSNQPNKLVLQKVTRFDGVLMKKVFFTNTSIYGKIMVSISQNLKRRKTTRDSSDKEANYETKLMLHKIKDVIVCEDDLISNVG